MPPRSSTVQQKSSTPYWPGFRQGIFAKRDVYETREISAFFHDGSERPSREFVDQCEARVRQLVDGTGFAVNRTSVWSSNAASRQLPYNRRTGEWLEEFVDVDCRSPGGGPCVFQPGPHAVSLVGGVGWCCEVPVLGSPATGCGEAFSIVRQPPRVSDLLSACFPGPAAEGGACRSREETVLLSAEPCPEIRFGHTFPFLCLAGGASIRLGVRLRAGVDDPTLEEERAMTAEQERLGGFEGRSGER